MLMSVIKIITFLFIRSVLFNLIIFTQQGSIKRFKYLERLDKSWSKFKMRKKQYESKFKRTRDSNFDYFFSVRHLN
jgi:hypothetical protein